MNQCPDDSIPDDPIPIDPSMVRPVHLDRFLRAVHRRLLVLRAIERGGACAAVACAVAAVLIGAAMWTGRDALRMCVATVTVGAVAGIVWGLVRRPSMLRAAAEADRQLDLKDLLGTALAARR